MKTLKIRKHNINIIKIHDQVIEKPIQRIIEIKKRPSDPKFQGNS